MNGEQIIAYLRFLRNEGQEGVCSLSQHLALEGCSFVPDDKELIL